MLDAPSTRDVEHGVVTVNAKGEIVSRKTYMMREVVEVLDEKIDLEMIAITGGVFLMGSAGAQGYPDERLQHRVTITPFLMGKYLITQKQWRAIMGKHICRFKGAQNPVDSVSWEAACQFCERLSSHLGRYFRLPSEAEWEYACRAGTTMDFHFGETLTSDLANYNGEFTYRAEPKGVYRHATTQVGSFPPNAFGLFDMHGNLWEWCADVWHDSYTGAPDDGRAWISDGHSSDRVARGGCWHDTPDVCRSATRIKFKADEGDEYVGFRVVTTA
jgi:formylglycine-generating enzyme required for sulfatase activity